MTWGGSEKFFKAIREDTGIPHHADIGRPALRSDSIKYYDAFSYLGACRMWTEVGPQPVMISEIKAYLDLIGIEDVETKKKYLRLIQSMDRVELKHIASKRK